MLRHLINPYHTHSSMASDSASNWQPYVFVICYNKCDVKVEKKNIGWVATCSIFVTMMSYGTYGAAYYLPLGVTSGIRLSVVLIINLFIGIVAIVRIRLYTSDIVIGLRIVYCTRNGS